VPGACCAPLPAARSVEESDAAIRFAPSPNGMPEGDAGGQFAHVLPTQRESNPGPRQRASDQTAIIARYITVPPVRPTRLRRERGSVVVVWPNQCHEHFQLATSNTARDVSAGQRQNGVDIRGEFAGRWTQELKDGLSCFK